MQKQCDKAKIEAMKAVVVEFFSNDNQIKVALKQSERIARFQKDTDYIQNDITEWK